MLTLEDEVKLRNFARFLMTHTLVEVSAERFDEWFRLLKAAMAVLGFDASRYVTAIAEENKNLPPGYLL